MPEQKIYKYSLLEKKINALLVKYGAGKLAILLDNLSDNIDDTALIAFEKLLSISANGFDTNKKSILVSNSKGDKVVAARRAVVYIMFNDMSIEKENIRSMIKLKNIYRVEQINDYTVKCLTSEIMDKDYLEKFHAVRNKFLQEFEELRRREYELNKQNLNDNE
jgi:hypothetical protein